MNGPVPNKVDGLRDDSVRLRELVEQCAGLNTHDVHLLCKVAPEVWSYARCGDNYPGQPVSVEVDGVRAEICPTCVKDLREAWNKIPLEGGFAHRIARVKVFGEEASDSPPQLKVLATPAEGDDGVRCLLDVTTLGDLPLKVYLTAEVAHLLDDVKSPEPHGR
jgi:hypothetical protein